MTEDKLVLRATFSDVLDSQERLRSIISRLAAENRCLTVDEQSEFFREFAHATYGLGRDAPFKIFIDHDIYSLQNVEFAGRWIATRTSTRVQIPNVFGSDFSPFIDISVLWLRLLELLFLVFPIALDRSSSMSKERDATGGGQGYEFDPDE